MSFLCAAFFANEAQLPKLLERTNALALEDCLSALAKIHAEGLDPEIQLGIDLNRAALERCLGRARSISDDSLKTRFAQLWRQHSREGGLAESLEKFNR